jgi:HD superfamily phosphohydrolase YqeK
MKRSVLSYVAATVVLAILATVAVALVSHDPAGSDWTAAATFGLIGFFTALFSYRRGIGGESGSVSFLPLLSGVLVTPTTAIVVTVFFATIAATILHRKPVEKILFNAAQLAVATAIAACMLAPWHGLQAAGFAGPAHFIGFLAAGVSFIAANSLLVAGAFAVADGRNFWPTWQRIVAATIWYDLFALPVIGLLAWSYADHGAWWLLAIVVPLLGLRQLYKQNAQLEHATQELLQIMVAAMEARDPYTSGHSRRVAAYAVAIAKGARLPAKVIDRVQVAALLHDVGKIYEVYAPLLRKPGRLTQDEVAVIQTHPIKSAELVSRVSQLRDVVAAVRGHHERWDGEGYPDRLRGAAIPLAARIIALADTIDAMRSFRPYRDPATIEAVYLEISSNGGSQFDPVLTATALAPANWRRLDQMMRTFERSTPHHPAAQKPASVTSEREVSSV